MAIVDAPRVLVCSLIALAALWPAHALAQKADAVSAEALFDDALKLMEQSRYAEACPKLEESERLDPAVGTLLNLGDCLDRLGDASRAWATFREAEAMATHGKQAARAKYAQKRASEIEPRLVRVTVNVPDAARVPGLEVVRDGEPMSAPLWGTPLPLNAGKHTIVARAPGYKTLETTFDASSPAASFELPVLEKQPEAPPEKPPPVVTPPTVVVVQAPPPSKPEAPPPPRAGQKVAATVVGVFGGLSLVTGGVFGLLAITKNDSAKSAGCDATTCPTQEGLALTSDAQAYANVSTWSLVLGGVLGAGAVVLWLTAPADPNQAKAWLSPLPGGAALGGAF